MIRDSSFARWMFADHQHADESGAMSRAASEHELDWSRGNTLTGFSVHGRDVHPSSAGAGSHHHQPHHHRAYAHHPHHHNLHSSHNQHAPVPPGLQRVTSMASSMGFSDYDAASHAGSSSPHSTWWRGAFVLTSIASTVGTLGVTLLMLRGGRDRTFTNNAPVVLEGRSARTAIIMQGSVLALNSLACYAAFYWLPRGHVSTFADDASSWHGSSPLRSARGLSAVRSLTDFFTGRSRMSLPASSRPASPMSHTHHDSHLPAISATAGQHHHPQHHDGHSDSFSINMSHPGSGRPRSPRHQRHRSVHFDNVPPDHSGEFHHHQQHHHDLHHHEYQHHDVDQDGNFAPPRQLAEFGSPIRDLPPLASPLHPMRGSAMRRNDSHQFMGPGPVIPAAQRGGSFTSAGSHQHHQRSYEYRNVHHDGDAVQAQGEQPHHEHAASDGAIAGAASSGSGGGSSASIRATMQVLPPRLVALPPPPSSAPTRPLHAPSLSAAAAAGGDADATFVLHHPQEHPSPLVPTATPNTPAAASGGGLTNVNISTMTPQETPTARGDGSKDFGASIAGGDVTGVAAATRGGELSGMAGLRGDTFVVDSVGPTRPLGPSVVPASSSGAMPTDEAASVGVGSSTVAGYAFGATALPSTDLADFDFDDVASTSTDEDDAEARVVAVRDSSDSQGTENERGRSGDAATSPHAAQPASTSTGTAPGDTAAESPSPDRDIAALQSAFAAEVRAGSSDLARPSDGKPRSRRLRQPHSDSVATAAAPMHTRSYSAGDSGTAPPASLHASEGDNLRTTYEGAEGEVAAMSGGPPRHARTLSLLPSLSAGNYGPMLRSVSPDGPRLRRFASRRGSDSSVGGGGFISPMLRTGVNGAAVVAGVGSDAAQVPLVAFVPHLLRTLPSAEDVALSALTNAVPTTAPSAIAAHSTSLGATAISTAGATTVSTVAPVGQLSSANAAAVAASAQIAQGPGGNVNVTPPRPMLAAAFSPRRGPDEAAAQISPTVSASSLRLGRGVAQGVGLLRGDFRWWNEMTEASTKPGTVLTLLIEPPSQAVTSTPGAAAATVHPRFLDDAAALVGLAIEAASACSGVVDSFQLSQVTISFNALAACADHEAAAAWCALQIREAFYTAYGGAAQLRFAMGIERSQVRGGHVGCGTEIRSFVVVGHAVNRSRDLARLGMTAFGGFGSIVVSEGFRDCVTSRFFTAPVDRVAFGHTATIPLTAASPRMLSARGAGSMVSACSGVNVAAAAPPPTATAIYELVDGAEDDRAMTAPGSPSLAGVLTGPTGPGATPLAVTSPAATNVGGLMSELTTPAMRPSGAAAAAAAAATLFEAKETACAAFEQIYEALRCSDVEAALSACEEADAALTEVARAAGAARRTSLAPGSGAGGGSWRTAQLVTDASPSPTARSATVASGLLVDAWDGCLRPHLHRLRRVLREWAPRLRQGGAYVRTVQPLWHLWACETAVGCGCPTEVNVGLAGNMIEPGHGAMPPMALPRMAPLEGTTGAAAAAAALPDGALGGEGGDVASPMLRDQILHSISPLRLESARPVAARSGDVAVGAGLPPESPARGARAANAVAVADSFPSPSVSRPSVVSPVTSSRRPPGRSSRPRALFESPSSIVDRLQQQARTPIQNAANVCIESDTLFSDVTAPLLFQDVHGVWYRRSSRRLGSGATGDVWLGMRATDGVLVAIKCLSLEDEPLDATRTRRRRMAEERVSRLDRIKSEVLALSDNPHENVVSFYGCAVVRHQLAATTTGSSSVALASGGGARGGDPNENSTSSALLTPGADGEVFLLMEYVSGGSLDMVLQSFRTLDTPTLQRYLKGILRGLRFLHGRGLVHRDIKPANILLTTTGACKIADLGSSIAAKSVSDGGIHGTPWYMAPEQARGHPVPASDLWSVGIMCVQLCSGVLPFAPDTDGSGAIGVHRFLHQLANDDSQSIITLPDVVARDPLLASFVGQCLTRDPAQRGTAESLLHHSFLTQQLRNRDVGLPVSSPSARRAAHGGLSFASNPANGGTPNASTSTVIPFSHAAGSASTSAVSQGGAGAFGVGPPPLSSPLSLQRQRQQLRGQAAAVHSPSSGPDATPRDTAATAASASLGSRPAGSVDDASPLPPPDGNPQGGGGGANAGAGTSHESMKESPLAESVLSINSE